MGFRKGVGERESSSSEMLVSVGSQSIVRFNCSFVLEVTVRLRRGWRKWASRVL